MRVRFLTEFPFQTRLLPLPPMEICNTAIGGTLNEKKLEICEISHFSLSSFEGLYNGSYKFKKKKKDIAKVTRFHRPCFTMKITASSTNKYKSNQILIYYVLFS